MKLTPEQLKEQLKLIKSSNLKDDVEISLEEIESFGNKESLKEMLTNIHRYNQMLKERITLINEPLSATIPFTRENLYLFCAYTGSGKSTVAANITYPLWKQGKKVLVLSNEESEQDVIFRVACLDLGLNFNDYKKGTMPTEDQLKVLSLFPEITKYVKVIDVTYKDGLTTKVEGIKKALEAVKKQDSYSCVLIDYYQLIKYSLTDPKKTAYENLNDLRIWLGQYIKSSSMPVVLFAQLYSLSKRGGAKDIDTRIKDCTAIVEPATVIIEVVPNFENQTSEFIIHKDRFGRAGNKIVCGFEKGRYIKLTPEELAKREMACKLKAQEEKLNKLN
ncbi:MAG: DnaB-like helicase C-terminal domain-containing protein, partial [Candidatus Caldarchaeum sp.]